MRILLRILRITIVSVVVALVFIAMAVLYALTEPGLRKRHTITPHPITLPRDSASIAEGERLAAIRGCTGCHGEKGQGDVFVDELLLGRIVSSNLTIASARNVTDSICAVTTATSAGPFPISLSWPRIRVRTSPV